MSNIKRSVLWFLIGVNASLWSALIAHLFILTVPSSIASETAMEFFKVLAGIAGALIGFTALIGVLAFKQAHDATHPQVLYSVFFVVFIYLGSVLFSLHGMLHLNSAPISSEFFYIPTMLLVAGTAAFGCFMYLVTTK